MHLNGRGQSTCAYRGKESGCVCVCVCVGNMKVSLYPECLGDLSHDTTHIWKVRRHHIQFYDSMP